MLGLLPSLDRVKLVQRRRECVLILGPLRTVTQQDEVSLRLCCSMQPLLLYIYPLMTRSAVVGRRVCVHSSVLQFLYPLLHSGHSLSLASNFSQRDGLYTAKKRVARHYSPQSSSRRSREVINRRTTIWRNFKHTNRQVDLPREVDRRPRNAAAALNVMKAASCVISAFVNPAQV